MTRRLVIAGVVSAVLSAPTAGAVPDLLKTSTIQYAAAAEDVMHDIERDFSLEKSGLYAYSIANRRPDFMWGSGVMFSALVGAAKHDPKKYAPRMKSYFQALDRYWDAKAAIPGYEPSPTAGNGHDKYYDDNAWMVITFAEAHALTGDAAYLRRADQTMTFVLCGEDDTLGGGIWWHEQHKDDSKNTCANAPAAVGLLCLARLAPNGRANELTASAKRLTEWTTRRLQLPSGLYADKVTAKTGAVEKTTWSYNTGLMIRAFVGLYRQTGDRTFLQQAERIATAADALLDRNTRAYHDGLKFTHLMAEADIDLFRITGNEAWLRRAVTTADIAYKAWKTRPPTEVIDNAALARLLWLLADLQSNAANTN